MRLCSGMKSIKRFSSDIECGRKAKCQLRAGKIVIDRFGNAEDRKTKPVKSRRYAQRAFASHNDEAFDAQSFQVCNCFIVDIIYLVRAFAGAAVREISAIPRAKNRAAAGQQAAYMTGAQFAGLGFTEESFK